MRSNLSLVTICALLGTAAATTTTAGPILSEGIEDGFYYTYVDDSGNTVNELLAAPNNTNFVDGFAPVVPKPRIVKRATGMSWCGCGRNMNHANCDEANQDLKNQIAARGSISVKGGTCYYSIRGAAVAFVCNPYNWVRPNQPFWASHVGESDAVVTSDCGWYVAGNYAWGYETSYLVGYMQYTPGLDFMKNARGSSARSC